VVPRAEQNTNKEIEMEKKYQYAYMETREFSEFTKIAKLDEIVIDDKTRFIITYLDGRTKDVTNALCMGGWFTEEEAERTIKYYRKTGYWPGEMPPEYEAEYME
jgi:hypothetical protein